MGFGLMDTSFQPILLSTWCTLNTSYGGTLLGLIGFSGIVSVGGKLLVGLPTTSSTIASERYTQNKKRRLSILLGGLTLAPLVGTVGSFFVCADSLRALGQTCDVGKVATVSLRPLYVFYFLATISAILSICFHVRTAKPRNQSAD